MSDDPPQRSPMRNLARFEMAEVEAYRRDLPKAEVQALDAGHFALHKKAGEIAEYISTFFTRIFDGRAPPQ